MSKSSQPPIPFSPRFFRLLYLIIRERFRKFPPDVH